MPSSKQESETWWSVLRGLLFGFDFFISYSHDGHASRYAKRLQERLAERDYVSFRDATNLKPGDPLTVKIRLGLRRTRCLVVLATERAVQSKWVAKEIGLFSQRSRQIVPIDLEDVREKHEWAPLEDVIFLEDTLPEPSSDALDELVGSFRGQRANRRARTAMAVAATVAFGVSIALAALGSALVDRSQRLRSQALVRIAQSHPDPLKQALILLEADPAHLSADAAPIVRSIAEAASPSAVLRASNQEVELIAFLDAESFISLDQAGDVRRWRVDGRGDPAVLGTLPEIIGDHGITTSRNAIFSADDDRFAILFLNGKTWETEIVEDSAEDEEDWDEEGWDEDSEDEWDEEEDEIVERWIAAQFDSAWRVSPAGRFVAYMTDVEEIDFFDTTEGPDPTAVLQLPGMAALDVTVEPSTVESVRISGLVLTTDGALIDYSIGYDGSTSYEVRQRLLDSGEENLALGGSAEEHAFTGDGRKLVVGATDEDGDVTRILAVDIESGHVTTFVAEGALEGWWVGPDGEYAILDEGSSRFSLLDLNDVKRKPAPESIRRPQLRNSPSTTVRTQDESGEPRAASFGRSQLPPRANHVVLVSTTVAWLWRPPRDGFPETLTPLSADLFFDEGCRPQFSDDGTLVAIADANGEIRIWPLDGRGRDPSVTMLRGNAYDLASGPSDMLMTGSEDGSVYIVSAEDSTHEARIVAEGPKGRIACGLSPDGARGVAVFEDGTVHVIELPSGRLESQFVFEPGASETPIYLEAAFVDATTVAIVGGDRYGIWRPATGLRTIELEGSEDLRVDPQGDYVLAQHGRKLIVHAIEDGARVDSIDVDAQVWDTAIAGGRVLATMSDGVVLRWELNGSGPQKDVIEGEPMVTSGALSPDGVWAAIGTDGGRVALSRFESAGFDRWLIAPTLRQASDRSEFRAAHLGIVFELQLSQSADRLLTCGGIDTTCRVWTLRGAHVSDLSLRAIPTGIRLLDDGRVVTLGERGEVAVWRPDLASLLTHLRSRTTATLAPAERVRYLGETNEEAVARSTAQEHAFERGPVPGTFLDIDFDVSR